MRNTSASASGAFTRLKKGGPTVIFTPRTHSEMTGKTVPQKTVKAIPTSARLFSRKAASRENTDSSSLRLLSSGRRQTSRPSESASIASRNPMKNGPRPDCVKE